MNLPTLIEDIGEIDDIIDGFLEPIKDITDTVSDLVGPVKTAQKLYSLRKKYQFKALMKGFYQVDYGNSNYELIRSRFREKIHEKEGVLVLSEIIEEAMKSRSLTATMMIGLICGEYVYGENPKLSDEDYLLIGGLKNVSDLDLDNLVELERLTSIEEIPRRNFQGLNEYSIEEIIQKGLGHFLSVEQRKLERSIQMLKRGNIISYSSGGIGRFGNNLGTFILDSTSIRCLELLKKCT